VAVLPSLAAQTPISNHKVMVQHYQSKHPNAQPPPEPSS